MTEHEEIRKGGRRIWQQRSEEFLQMKKLILIAGLFLGVCGCKSAPPPVYLAQGTVRNVWCNIGRCDVTFEHDNGDVVVFHITGVPSMWAGMRCKLTYQMSPVDRYYCHFLIVERIK